MNRKSTRRHPAPPPEAHGEGGGLNTAAVPISDPSSSVLSARSPSRSSLEHDVPGRTTASKTTAADATSAASAKVTRRRAKQSVNHHSTAKMDVESQRRRVAEDPGDDESILEDLSRSSSSRTAKGLATRNQWIALAVASGACAAFNGVFAKLTTNDLTTKISSAVAGFLGLNAAEGVLELLIRCIFFGLNLAFNGVMWSLFTTALARGNSTTQVQVVNTSANFMLTALLGLAVFSESLPPLWWVGASLLVAGTVIVGRKDEHEQEGRDGGVSGAAGPALEVEAEPLIRVPSSSSSVGPRSRKAAEKKAGEDEEDEDVPDLDVGGSSSSSSVLLVER